MDPHRRLGGNLQIAQELILNGNLQGALEQYTSSLKEIADTIATKSPHSQSRNQDEPPDWDQIFQLANHCLLSMEQLVKMTPNRAGQVQVSAGSVTMNDFITKSSRSVSSPVGQSVQSLSSRSGPANLSSHGNYLPLIPMSPLMLAIKSASDQQESLNQQLQSITKTDANSLAQTRRSAESLKLLKEKMTTLRNQVSDASSKSILDMTPIDVANQLAIFDAELFGLIQPQDILTLNQNSGRLMQSGGETALFPPYSEPVQQMIPHSIRSVLDFSLFVERVVQITILSFPESHLRGRAISKWIDVLAECFQVHSFPSINAIVKGLSSPAILHLEQSWNLVASKQKQIFLDFQAMMSLDETSSSNNARSRAASASVLDTKSSQRYFSVLNRLGANAVPWLNPLLLQVLRASIQQGASQTTIVPFIQTLNLYKTGCSTTTFPPFQYKAQLFPVGHWLVSQVWMNLDQIKTRAEQVEPSRAPVVQQRRWEDTVASLPQSVAHSRSGSVQVEQPGLIQQLSARIQSSSLLGDSSGSAGLTSPTILSQQQDPSTASNAGQRPLVNGVRVLPTITQEQEKRESMVLASGNGTMTPPPAYSPATNRRQTGVAHSSATSSGPVPGNDEDFDAVLQRLQSRASVSKSSTETEAPTSSSQDPSQGDDDPFDAILKRMK